MKYVFDACVALKWVLEEPFSDLARNLRRDAEQGIHELIAPDVFLIEVAHTITKLARQRTITSEQAEAFLADVLLTPPQLFSSADLLPQAVKLSLNRRAALNDCFYVALAERRDCSVVTADERLQRGFDDDTPHVVHLSII